MADRYSFTDELARLNAETRREQEHAEGQEKRRRFLDYQLGKAIGTTLAGRIASAARSAEEAVRNLRHAAQDQGNTLVGRVASGELNETAQDYEGEVERQRPQREADARRVAIVERMARQHADQQAETQRDWYDRHREPGR